ncbi:MAG: outer membrane protein [Bryobacteraceae bacterium]
MRSLLLLLAAVSGAVAQPFTAGVKLGVPLTDFLTAAESGDTSYSTITNRYIVGLEGELRLPFGLGIELDVLYRHVNYSSTTIPTTPVNPLTTASTTSNDWEFPLVAKYKFKAPVVRPYVEAGVAWDTLQGLTQTVKSTVAGIAGSSSSTSNPAELANSSTRGFVLGGGVDIHALLIHITPEIRYTRWGARQFFAPGLLSSNQNQAEFLVGVTF